MIAVIMATYNGAVTLPATLSSFCQLETPDEGYRLIIIDNGSSDETPNILEQYKNQLPLTVLSEPTPGKNFALNTAIEHLLDNEPDANLYVFTDDDVLPEKNWLRVYSQAIKDYPDYSMFGGRITPKWPSKKPDWLDSFQDEFTMLYAESDEPDGPCEAMYLFGPNMAIRSSIFQKGMRYNIEFGLEGGRSNQAIQQQNSWLLSLIGDTSLAPMGSETEFVVESEKSGEKSRYLTESHVRHIVRDFQLDWEWILRRSFRAGRGCLEREPTTSSRQFQGVPYWLFKNLLLNTLALLKTKKISPQRRVLKYEREWIKGAICGAHIHYLIINSPPKEQRKIA